MTRFVTEEPKTIECNEEEDSRSNCFTSEDEKKKKEIQKFFSLERFYSKSQPIKLIVEFGSFHELNFTSIALNH